MAKYLTSIEFSVLRLAAEKISVIRNDVFAQLGIDILDTDTMSSIPISDIMLQIDPNYNCNFSRNGEDAKSKSSNGNDIYIEQKSAKIKIGKKIYLASFAFHAHGELIYDRYIFVARDVTTLAPARLYDISRPENIKKIHNILTCEQAKWDEKCRISGTMLKFDVIYVPEKTLIESMEISKTTTVNNCKVFLA